MSNEGFLKFVRNKTEKDLVTVIQEETVDKVSVNSQVLTSEQKTQAQTNVGGPFLPLAGGSMLGGINVKAKTESDASVYCLTDGGEIQICAGAKTFETLTKGTALTLRTKATENIEDEGETSFSIDVKSASSRYTFIGTSQGNLQWDGKEVERVNAIGENYIRYESGLQICWGTVIADSAGKDWAFPVPYKGTNYVAFITPRGTSTNVISVCDPDSNTRLTVYNSVNYGVSVVVIGRWK